jgi:group I intron endonuclease
MKTPIFIVYKTINVVTGRYYIGKHCQYSNDFDGYFGSGPSLNKDIISFGIDNFIRETLHSFDNEGDCYLFEKKEVGDLWKTDPLCYNKQPGGKGFSSGENHYAFLDGFSSEHRKNLSKARKKRVPASAKTREKMSKSRTGLKRNVETKKKMSKAQLGEKNPMYNRSHSDKSKKQIGNSLSGKYVGEKSSRFKGYYITPFGKFASIREATIADLTISGGTIAKWCKNSSTVITRNMVGISKYLTSGMLDKTFKEIGFYMEKQ